MAHQHTGLRLKPKTVILAKSDPMFLFSICCFSFSFAYSMLAWHHILIKLQKWMMVIDFDEKRRTGQLLVSLIINGDGGCGW